MLTCIALLIQHLLNKLEKEKATNKWLHVMFSSISHEFRTPINAFTNALSLIELMVESIQNNYDVPEVKHSEISLNRLSKHFSFAEKKLDKIILKESNKTFESIYK